MLEGIYICMRTNRSCTIQKQAGMPLQHASTRLQVIKNEDVNIYISKYKCIYTYDYDDMYINTYIYIYIYIYM